MAHLAPHLVDEILEEIFLRLPTPTALARASTACSSFRGIITARSFLRRYRALHPPPLLGFATEGGFLPAQDPHPPPWLARALVDGADFSYPMSQSPTMAVCSPLVPLRRARRLRPPRLQPLVSPVDHDHLQISPRGVRSPVTERYLLLPLIPGDMTLTHTKSIFVDSSLSVPTGDVEDETSFRVICWADYESKFVMFVFFCHRKMVYGCFFQLEFIWYG
ncbi:hypothetical protein ZWY2020_016478 [Hordeum vulgare]|nr:hypothetical protein ZWY2020_016478 [Hordeum vulgare]